MIRSAPVPLFSVQGIVPEHVYQCGQFVDYLPGSDEFDAEASKLFNPANGHGTKKSGFAVLHSLLRKG